VVWNLFNIFFSEFSFNGLFLFYFCTLGLGLRLAWLGLLFFPSTPAFKLKAGGSDLIRTMNWERNELNEGHENHLLESESGNFLWSYRQKLG